MHNIRKDCKLLYSKPIFNFPEQIPNPTRKNRKKTTTTSPHITSYMNIFIFPRHYNNNTYTRRIVRLAFCDLGRLRNTPVWGLQIDRTRPGGTKTGNGNYVNQTKDSLLVLAEWRHDNQGPRSRSTHVWRHCLSHIGDPESVVYVLCFAGSRSGSGSVGVVEGFIGIDGLFWVCRRACARVEGFEYDNIFLLISVNFYYLCVVFY